MSPAPLSRLKPGGHDELAQWQQRDLAGKRSVSFWVDGVYCETRLEKARHCILVIMGADASGQKELVGLWDGDRESEQAWQELLLDLQSRGLGQGPALAIGDGALGFWKALRRVSGQTRWQRCGVHQTANVFDKLPKEVQPQAKQRRQALWMAPDRQRAEMACDLCIATYDAKYPKAAACLAQDRKVVLALYEFPAEHWGHMRTTTPIESTFATVRARTDKTRGGLSRSTMLAMVCTLSQSAATRWHRLRAAPDLPEVMNGTVFTDGIRVDQDAA